MAKTVLVTGATQGIGQSIAQRLSHHGYCVVGIARNPDNTFCGDLVIADFDDEISARNALQYIASSYNIDGIVNNIGIAGRTDANAVNKAHFDSMMHLNVFSAMLTVEYFIDAMRKKGWGRIVNIASRALLGLEHFSVYSASKAALVAYTRTCAIEFAQANITVNAIAPGPIDTPAYRVSRPEGSTIANTVLEKIPMKRIGQPYEVAAAVDFLLSDDASFITGQTLFVDGGFSIGGHGVF